MAFHSFSSAGNKKKVNFVFKANIKEHAEKYNNQHSKRLSEKRKYRLTFSKPSDHRIDDPFQRKSSFCSVGVLVSKPHSFLCHGHNAIPDTSLSI